MNGIVLFFKKNCNLQDWWHWWFRAAGRKQIRYQIGVDPSVAEIIFRKYLRRHRFTRADLYRCLSFLRHYPEHRRLWTVRPVGDHMRRSHSQHLLQAANLVCSAVFVTLQCVLQRRRVRIHFEQLKKMLNNWVSCVPFWSLFF